MKNIIIILLIFLSGVSFSQISPIMIQAQAADSVLISYAIGSYYGAKWVDANLIDNQLISLDSNATTYTATVSNGGSIQWAKAAGSTDDQQLTLDSSSTSYYLDIESGNQVLWAKSTNTDAQTLSFANPNLSITGGNSVDISGIDTDNQTIDLFSFSNPTLSLSLQDDGEATKTVNLSALSDGNGIYDGGGSVGSGETQVTAGAGSFMVFDVTGTAGSGTWGSFEVEINGSDAMNINAASNNVAIDGTTFVVETDENQVGVGTSSPAYLFDVNGDSRLNGDVYDSNTSSGADGYYLGQDAGGIVWERSTTPFAQYNTTVQQIINTSGSGEKVIDWAEEYDPSSFYSFNGTTDVVTPSQAGYYKITVGFEVSISSGTPTGTVYICNGAGTALENFAVAPRSTSEWMEVSHIEYWASSPSVTIYASNGGSDAWNFGYAKLIIERISK